MMKKLMFIAAAATMIAACAKSEAPSSENDLTPETSPSEANAPQQVIFKANLNSEQETKASQGHGTVTEWNSQDLWIIGFDDTKLADANEISEENGFLIPNVKGIAPAQGTSPVKEGQMTLWHGQRSDGSDEPFYYNEQVDAYSFCGYYVDDAVDNPAPAVENGVITLKNIPINGSQDILAAITDKEQDRTIPEDFEDASLRGKKVKTDYVYSAYSARKGINPGLVFNHMLSRFTFNLQVGGTDKETIAPKITINELTFDSYATGDLQIYPAPQITKTTNETTSLNLIGLPQDLNTDFAQGIYKSICDAIMVIPGEESYNMHLSFKQEGCELAGNNGIVTYDIPINIANVVATETDPAHEVGDKFLAGKQYNINIMIYGLEEVKITVSLVDWDEWGTFTYDPDDKDGIDSES